MLNITDLELLDQCRQALQEAGLEVPESSFSSPVASPAKAKLAPTNHEGASSNTVPLSKVNVFNSLNICIEVHRDVLLVPAESFADMKEGIIS